MKERRRVAFGLYQGSDLPLREGVFRYASEHDWAMIVNPYQVLTSLKWIEHETGLDGVIGFVQHNELSLVESLNLPVVSISRSGRVGLPTVVDDSERVGMEAAKHLLADCLLRRFGYLGRNGPHFSEYRMKGFVDTVKAAGFACSVWRTSGAIDAYHWQQEQEGLEEWLRSLRPPVGVMISDDADGLPAARGRPPPRTALPNGSGHRQREQRVYLRTDASDAHKRRPVPCAGRVRGRQPA